VTKEIFIFSLPMETVSLQLLKVLLGRLGLQGCQVHRDLQERRETLVVQDLLD
jgi:hypothetical protein